MQVERVMELANLAANKNTIPGDVSAMTPGGIRMGTPALTSRGFDEADFEKVAEFFDRAVTIADDIKTKTGGKIKDFKAALENGPDDFPALVQLKNEVIDFARKFPTVGF
jgi:glycine hydroxymethyltransferase